MQEAAPRPTHVDEASGTEEEHMETNRGGSTVHPLFVPGSSNTRFRHHEVTTAYSAKMFEALRPEKI